MKKRILTPALLAGLLGLLAIVAAHATSEGSLTVNVPFDFTCGKTLIPAGSYTVSEISIEGQSFLRSIDGPRGIFVSTNNADADKEGKPRLIFHRYGNQYFLAQIQYGTGHAREVALYGKELQLRADLLATPYKSQMQAELVYVEAR
jgi:hypothetical protein